MREKEGKAEKKLPLIANYIKGDNDIVSDIKKGKYSGLLELDYVSIMPRCSFNLVSQEDFNSLVSSLVFCLSPLWIFEESLDHSSQASSEQIDSDEKSEQGIVVEYAQSESIDKITSNGSIAENASLVNSTIENPGRANNQSTDFVQMFGRYLILSNCEKSRITRHINAVVKYLRGWLRSRCITCDQVIF